MDLSCVRNYYRKSILNLHFNDTLIWILSIQVWCHWKAGSSSIQGQLFLDAFNAFRVHSIILKLAQIIAFYSYFLLLHNLVWMKFKLHMCSNGTAIIYVMTSTRPSTFRFSIMSQYTNRTGDDEFKKIFFLTEWILISVPLGL